MHYAHAMRLVESFGHFGSIAQNQFEWEPPFHQPGAERFSFEELHDDVVNTVLLSEIVELADVGVAELRDRARLALKTLERFRLLGKMGRQHLDRNRAVQSRVDRAIDFAHPANA